MLRVAVGLIGLAGVPVLLVLAWRGWAKHIRTELPPWRNGLCISALLLLSVNWLGVAALEVPVLVNSRLKRPTDLIEGMLTLSHLLSVIVVILALALRRVPRIQ